ncbi:MAG: ABC transporter ATP-binding protein [Hydrotalea sp.]|nr:ABC transporter ATP-binding protein [Hydrotalea sp.]
MSQPAIIIENLSKQYRLGDVGTGTLSHDLKRWWYAVRGKEDPFAKIGETNDRTQKGNSEYVWALKDINLQINQGDAVGIIGRNGAGKSTLLKLLSKTTAPTTGSIKVKGRIASLLEVGTGFHPELSGRDNIYLNGAILGMRKREIDRKLDEIVDFAGIERYIDTPVKRYSSGMYVRLAFAVAAHLDSDILIVDEVLAVGDAEFQKKCLGKMGEVSQGQGRTVLFVSHNMESICKLCQNAKLFKDGKLIKEGKSNDVIEEYLFEKSLDFNKKSNLNSKTRIGEQNVRFIDTWTEDDKKNKRTKFKAGETIRILARLNKLATNVKPLQISFGISTIREVSITDLSNVLTNQEFISESSDVVIECLIKKAPFNVGVYVYNLMVRQQGQIEDWIINASHFEIVSGDYFGSGKIPDSNRLIFVDQDWKLNS